eukprot:3831001-Pyramimonas_sp.AAC.1
MKDIASQNQKNELRHELKTLVRDAKRQVAEWGLSDEDKILDTNAKYGGFEGIGTLLRLAAIDADNDGDISDKELENFTETSSSILNAFLSLLLNVGVLSTLNFSVVFPVVLQPIPVSESAVRFFGEHTVEIFESVVISVACLHLLGSLCTISYSIYLYTALTVWMPDEMHQTRLARHSTKSFRSLLSWTMVQLAVIPLIWAPLYIACHTPRNALIIVFALELVVALAYVLLHLKPLLVLAARTLHDAANKAAQTMEVEFRND